jgi:hypothetical protein
VHDDRARRTDTNTARPHPPAEPTTLEVTMRRYTTIAATVLGAGLLMAACSGDADSADPDEHAEHGGAETDSEGAGDGDESHSGHGADDAHEGHEGHGDDAESGSEGSDPHAAHNSERDTTEIDEGPVVVRVHGTSTGHYQELAEGLGAFDNTLVVEGTATLVEDENGTTLTTEATGLTDGLPHPSHLHDGSCDSFGGHYADDPAGGMSPPNELWASSTSDPEGSLEPSPTGSATGGGSVDWTPREIPLSLMIHDSELPGLPIACADFSAYDDTATVVLTGADESVESIEYSVDGGEWQPYAEPVVIDGAGSYSVSYAGVDASGERGEESEVSFEIVDSGSH